MAEALAALVVPYILDASKSALLFAWQQYETLGDYKMQCKVLLQRCQSLLVAVCDHQKDINLQSMQDNLHVLENACTAVKDTISSIAGKPFVWRLLHQDEIAKALSAGDVKIQDALAIYNVAAHIDGQYLQLHSLAVMAEASAQDHAELVKQLELLSLNDHKILRALQTSHLRLEELLVALMKHVQVLTAPSATPTDKFIKRAVGALQRLSKEPLSTSIASWQLTSLEVTFDREDPDNEIGRGSFGIVYKGVWRGMVVAVKEMYFEDAKGLDRNSFKVIRNEVAVWSRLSHPCILPFYGACLEATRPFMVARHCEKGTILDYLRENQGTNCLDFIVHISSGMAYLHSQNIVHADLKAVNILIGDDLKAVISDFGVSHLKDQASVTTYARTGVVKPRGTLRWMAPEILEGKRIDFPADVYAFGITIWEIYTLEVPFSDISDLALYWRVIEKKERPQCPLTMDEGLRNLTQRCWNHHPQERPDFKVISSLLWKMVDAGMNKATDLRDVSLRTIPLLREKETTSVEKDVNVVKAELTGLDGQQTKSDPIKTELNSYSSLSKAPLQTAKKSRIRNLLQKSSKWFQVKSVDETRTTHIDLLGTESTNSVSEGTNYKVKALYAYTADPSDPKEISLDAGETLDVINKSGKWWEVRKADGQVGLALSHYLRVVDPATESESYSYKVKALYAYTGDKDDPNEISFLKNEILDVFDKQGKWWQARKADGTTGIIPSNYVKIIETLKSTTNINTSSKDEATESPSPLNSPSDASSNESMKYLYKAKALYAYTADTSDPEEVSFSKGDILDLENNQGKWWKVKKADGTRGIAPSNYLLII